MMTDFAQIIVDTGGSYGTEYDGKTIEFCFYCDANLDTNNHKDKCPYLLAGEHIRLNEKKKIGLITRLKDLLEYNLKNMTYPDDLNELNELISVTNSYVELPKTT